MNAMQYYIIDSYIKNKNPTHTLLQDSPSISGRRASSASARYSFDSSNNVFLSDDDDDDEMLNSRTLLQPSSSANNNGDINPHRKLGMKSPIVVEYNPDTDGSTLQDGLDGAPPQPQHSTSPSSTSFQALRSGRKGFPTKGNGGAAAGSSKSGNSSMMLLPGSRGPSTPGYGEEESLGLGKGGFGGRSGSDGDDEVTLIGKDEDLERRLGGR